MFTVPAVDGAVYFKATGEQLASETELTVFLAGLYPDLLPDILAFDMDRNWLLMREGGRRLREVISADRDIGHWEKLLPRYAELQIAMAEKVSLLIEMGIADHRLPTIPRLFEELLADESVLRLGLEDGLGHEEAETLWQRTVILHELCSELSSHRVPESIDHGDLHDGNVLVQNGRHILFDWGDSTITHPFFCLRTVFVSVENTLDLTREPVEARLLDAYLEPWTIYGPRQDLLEAAGLANKLAMINRAFTWRFFLNKLQEEERRQYQYGVTELLREFLAGASE